MTKQSAEHTEFMESQLQLRATIEKLNKSIEENNKVLDELKEVLGMNKKDEVEPALTLDERIDAIVTKRNSERVFNERKEARFI